MKTKKDTKVYQPTEAVKNNILRGIALKSKYSKVPQEQAEDILQMKSLLSNGFDLDSIKSIYHTLSNHKVDFRRRVNEGEPSEEIIKHYLYGGSAGLAWTKLVLKAEKIINSSTKVITSADINKAKDDKVFGSLAVEPVVNQELRQATYIAMAPDEIDFHGDVTSAEEVRKAKESFNRSKQNANLFHIAMTSSFSIIESYLAPADMVLDDKFVVKGTWLVTIQANDDDLWEAIKSGDISGISIGALATVETL